jgi:hypothetical protein
VVVAAIRELGKLEECGGLPGLNHVYAAHEPTQYSEAILSDYSAKLRVYALHRDNPTLPLCFTGGKGVLKPNKARRRGSDCDYVGEVICEGRRYSARLYVGKLQEFVNLTLAPL